MFATSSKNTGYSPCASPTEACLDGACTVQIRDDFDAAYS